MLTLRLRRSILIGFSIFINVCLYAQVSGIITDSETGEPLIGASILIQGSSLGTITDIDGRYSIDDVSQGDILELSYTGFDDVVITVGNEQVIDLTMSKGVVIDEVVVIAYGTVKKSDLTGSVSSIKEEDFNQGVNVAVDQLIAGRAAGVQVSNTSSEPGGGVSIRIRGANSITAGNEPLYVIDGLPVDNSNLIDAGGTAGIGSTVVGRNPLNALNPADIESIEILKDASATAIYGARGANGVVLITTKKGQDGKTQVTYDTYYGHQETPRRLDILDTDEYIQVMNEIAAEEIGEQIFDASDISRIGAGTDWQSEVLQSAPLMNHNLSFSGGNAKTSYYTSFNFLDQDGVVKETGIKKYGGRLNLSHEVSDKLKIGVNLNTSVEFDNFAIDNNQTNEAQGPVYASILYDPTEPITNENSIYGGLYNHSPELTVNNPVSLVFGIDSDGQTNRTFGNVTADYEVIDGLTAKLNFGSDRQNVRRDIYNSRSTFRGFASGGIANIATLELTNYLVEYTMNYVKELDSNNQLTLLGGVTYQDFQRRSFSADISGFPSDATASDNLGLGNTDTDNVFSNRQSNQLLSYLGRANYMLNNKYLFTASIRADGSSRFGANNKYGIFPSIAFAWKLTQEDFVPDGMDLKLRASWGITGNQEIGNFASLSTFTTGGDAILNNGIFAGTQPSRIANPDLKWEETSQTNIGIDYGFASGRFTGTIDWFQKKTNDLLLNLPLPASSGFGSILTNVGKVENSGIEFLFNSNNINTKKLRWTTSLNFSAISNKATDLGGQAQIITGGLSNVGNSAILTPGEPIFSYYGYNITGIFNSQSEVDASAQPSSQPGYPIFEDINSDGAITPADQMILGKPFPDFTYGIGNDISFGNFNFNFFIQGVQGVENINVQAVQSMYPANFRRNKFRRQYLDRWTPSNPDAIYPSGVSPAAYGGGKVNSLTIEDASFVRLRNATISYNLPLENVSAISQARIYITGQNLFTITDYISWDPEASLAGGTTAGRADDNSYPLTRTWLFGLTVNF